ncbi:putative disease resistance protein RGA3 [Rhododendron vialii]|uniref:putative disease resistance protein RGA3 n=1 Tax=Rhododendron vialii TaxID=182163 RepID=UPI00265D95DF|nr:putative disease resistance protein RGA3 [Rhododendron vialii]
MADVLLSSLIRTILANLTSSALQQFGIAWGLETELKNLESTLSTIQAVLVDAEAKQWTSEAVKNWLRKLKDSAYDADNVVDEFATEALKRKLDSQRGATHRVSSFFSLRNRLIFRLKMGNEIKGVNERLDKIVGERSFHLREGLLEPEFRAVEGRQTSSLVNELEIYGRNGEKEMIIEMLLDDLSDRNGVSVCAICGMGGLGKTTLAKLVYNDKRVEGHFDLRLWVCVSDINFDIKRLTGAIVESIEGGACNITNLDPLQRRLQEKLRGRRYLLVLDDVWNEYHEKWDRLKDVLRCGAKGSKVVVTTRSQKVALIMATLPVHHMVGLSEDDSWSLFEQRAFDNQKMKENHELFEIGKAIVKKCGGLPLAIKALGSLMQFKSSESEWLSLRDSKVWDLPDDGSTILPALRLSYDNLPPHLRQCFAYCCIFLKDSQMKKDMLIELWMANGFIPSKGETTLHDTGHEIFNDLVWRSFLQDVDENFDGETVCKMHDLMHDLALSIMQYDLYVMDSHKDMKVPGKVRHLLLNIHSAGGLTWNESMLEVPSLRLFALRPQCAHPRFSWEKVSPWISNQKYLRVLDLSAGTTFVKVPRLISNSNHLRYLDMSYSNIVYVPESICNLQNLETLKLIECYKLCKLPECMRYMRNLIYLDIKGCDSLTSMPPKLGQLTSLRRLSFFIVGQAEGYRISELKELNLAGKLVIKKLDNVRSPVDAESANLKRKLDLVSLHLHWTWSHQKEENLPNDVEGVLESLQPHSNLKKLSISYYRGSKFPNWMMCSVLKNLVELSLYSCSQCEQLPPLGKLHSLKKLNISGMDSLKYFDPECYEDGEISFQALETLSLGRMPSLEEWMTMDRQDVFPCLRELDIKSCPKLTNLPALPTLKRLGIGDNEKLLKSVNNLTSLSSLLISDLQLEILPDGLFQNHEALESLELRCMPNIETLQNWMSGLSSLKRLRLDDFPKLRNLSGLGIVNSLDSLDISGCDSLTDLEGLEGLTSLRSLYIQCCRKLRSLSEGMQLLTVLQHLLINGSPEIQSFPEGMRHLNSLQSMQIWHCEGLITLPNWLGSLQSLSYLGIWSCSNLRSMPDGLGGQKSLRELRIVECPNLERRCKKESGEDWLKIAHIPNIRINFEQVQSLDD